MARESESITTRQYLLGGLTRGLYYAREYLGSRKRLKLLRLGLVRLGRFLVFVLLVLVLIRHWGGGWVGDWACAVAAKGNILVFF